MSAVDKTVGWPFQQGLVYRTGWKTQQQKKKTTVKEGLYQHPVTRSGHFRAIIAKLTDSKWKLKGWRLPD